MKANILIIAVAASVVLVTSCSDDPDPKSGWTTLSDFPSSGRVGASGFSIGSRGYVCGGLHYLQPYSFFNDLWEFNPGTGAWTQKKDFPNGTRIQAIAFGIGDYGYMGTGYIDGIPQKDFWRYDPASNTWTQMDDFGGGERLNAASYVYNGKAYVATGEGLKDDVKIYPNDFWEFNPLSPAGQQWVRKKNVNNEEDGELPVETEPGFGFVLGDEGYIGMPRGFGFHDMWRYDHKTDTWEERTPPFLEFGVSAGVCFVLKGSAYIQSAGDMWMYDQHEDLWVEREKLFESEYLDYPTGFSIGKYGYVGVGRLNGTFPTKFYRYEPK